jgi:asparagine synthase (glutamine-hydrolysing)
VSGICGIVNFDGKPVDPVALRKMAQAMAHRGPDGIGYWIKENIGLAHLALHATIESVRERQPLVNRRGDTVLSADARVDNRHELIRTLTDKGYVREQYPTDADLIMAAYECWENECPKHIQGDFAFTVWREKDKSLFCARDRVGARPFYYLHNARQFLWASEIKSILAHPDAPTAINEKAIGVFLATGAHDAETLYENVLQLAHARTLDVDGGKLHIGRYWDIDPHHEIRYRDSGEYVNHFLGLFRGAVECRLRSHRATGVWLSGGRDSSSVTCVGAELLRNGQHKDCTPEIRTFSWLCEVATPSDEREFSSAVIAKYSLKAHTFIADGPNGKWPLADYPRVLPDRDTPFESLFDDLYRALLTAARESNVGIILTGAPGDSVAGGWNLYYFGELLRQARFRAIAEELKHYRRLLAHYQKDYPLDQNYRDTYYLRIARAVTPFILKETGRLLRQSRQISKQYPWINAAFASRIDLRDAVAETRVPKRFPDQAKQLRYQCLFSHKSLATMAWLEQIAATAQMDMRNPWMDSRLIGFVLAIPSQELAQGARGRLLMNRAMENIVPDIVRERTGKRFPLALLDLALRQRESTKLSSLLENPLTEEMGYIEGNRVREAFAHYHDGKISLSGWMWAVVCLEKWMRSHFARP